MFDLTQLKTELDTYKINSLADLQNAFDSCALLDTLERVISDSNLLDDDNVIDFINLTFCSACKTIIKTNTL